jgi:multidrug resistance efflux pump
LYTAPSYVLRGPIHLVFLILLACLIYSFFATKDVLVTAPLELKKDAFTIQVTGGGLVTELNVKDNSLVSFGDQLAVVQEQVRPFDNAQRDALESRQSELEKEYRKVESEYDNKIQQLEYDRTDLTTNRDARIKQLEGQINILDQQLATAINAVRASEGTLAIANRQYATTSKLFDTHDVTVTQRDSALEKQTIAQKSVFDARARVAEVQERLATAKVELTKFNSLFQAKKLDEELSQRGKQRERDLSKLREEINAITQRLSSAVSQEGTTFRENQAIYTSMFDGLITKVHAERGQIIVAGAPLVTMVRESAALEAHTFVENKDIGHLKRGQEVKIKYFAYPFQEYMIATGLISDIATTPSGLSGRESKYLVKIALRAETISKPGGKPKQLEIGLEGVAEIKTGEKRFIEILFSPVSKFLAPEEEQA